MLVIGIALVMNYVGLSPALGTFLAGVVLSDSEYRHELESDIEPFKGLLLGLVCNRPAAEVRDALLEQDILTGTSADPNVVRILAPLVITAEHVDHLARTLTRIPGRET